MRVVVLTHDVDWPLRGPGMQHVLARRDRFDAETIKRVVDEGFNPYFGIPVVKEIEARLGVRSTFFFRPRYDDGSTVFDYHDTMKALVGDGWEVGLHANYTSTVVEVIAEKKAIENTVGKPVHGSRVHYLKVSKNTFSNLAKAGLKYDSSLIFGKKRISSRNSGFVVRDGLIVFPVSFMDAYLFTYLGLNEETVVKFVTQEMEKLFVSNVQLVTLLWHDNSILMRGGRTYPKLIEELASRLDVTFLKGVEAFELVEGRNVH